ncbi:hypothetical protein ACOZE3_20615 [Streptomyces cinereoruber]|uniref:hypothetical protein n=1 Tax=Streptomyces cinereoruber TaxID=67260 RepID=UPI003BF5AFC6
MELRGVLTPAPTPTSEAPKEEPVEDAPVKVTAKRTELKQSILHDGSSAFTSVTVTVTNSGDKHTAELGIDEDQIDTVKLAPGENVTGAITGKGKFTPKYVTYIDGLFGDGVRGVEEQTFSIRARRSPLHKAVCGGFALVTALSPGRKPRRRTRVLTVHELVERVGDVRGEVSSGRAGRVRRRRSARRLRRA